MKQTRRQLARVLTPTFKRMNYSENQLQFGWALRRLTSPVEVDVLGASQQFGMRSAQPNPVWHFAVWPPTDLSNLQRAAIVCKILRQRFSCDRNLAWCSAMGLSHFEQNREQARYSTTYFSQGAR